MIKILYLILFYLIYRITDLVLLVVMLLQMGLSIFSGESSESIKSFGKSLGAYLQQISEFLSYASDEKPFPFSDWPEVLAVQPETAEVQSIVDVDCGTISEKSVAEERKSEECQSEELNDSTKDTNTSDKTA